MALAGFLSALLLVQLLAALLGQKTTRAGVNGHRRQR
jgi:hypothetical protein